MKSVWNLSATDCTVLMDVSCCCPQENLSAVRIYYDCQEVLPNQINKSQHEYRNRQIPPTDNNSAIVTYDTPTTTNISINSTINTHCHQMIMLLCESVPILALDLALSDIVLNSFNLRVSVQFISCSDIPCHSAIAKSSTYRAFRHWAALVTRHQYA